MHSVRMTIVTAGLLMMALLPIAAAVSADGAPERDPAAQPPVPVAIAQPLAVIDRPLVAAGHRAVISESGMLVLVGSALLGLAAVVRRTTRPD